MARVATRTLGQPLKNFFINADFGIWQRNVGTAGPFTEDTSYAYKGPDRWRHRYDDLVASSTVHQWSRINDSPFTVLGSVLGPSAFRATFRRANLGIYSVIIGQRVESFLSQELYNNNPSGKVSVAVWVKSDTATSINLVLYSATAQDNFSGETVILNSTKTFTANNTWQQVKWEGISVTAAMVNGIEALFTINTPAAVGADGSDKDIRITNCQLNKGEVIEQFSLAGLNPEGELALCQRYYEKTYNIDVSPGTVSQTGQLHHNHPGGVNVEGYYVYKVTKRGTPTVTFYNPQNGAAGSWRNNTNAQNLGMSPANSGSNASSYIISSVPSGAPEIVGHLTVEAEI